MDTEDLKEMEPEDEQQSEGMQKFTEAPHFVKYEDEDDIIIVRPATWEVVIQEKDTGKKYLVGNYDTKAEAKEAMFEELDELDGEGSDFFREKTEENDDDDEEDEIEKELA